MSPDEYLDAITRLGFASINEAGRWLELSDAAARRCGADGPHPNIAKFLEFMIAADFTPAEVDRTIRSWKARSTMERISR